MVLLVYPTTATRSSMTINTRLDYCASLERNRIAAEKDNQVEVEALSPLYITSLDVQTSKYYDCSRG